MLLTRFYIVLLAYLCPISAIIDNAQTALIESDVEVRVWSGPIVPIRGRPSHLISSSLTAADYETHENATLIGVRSSPRS